MENAAFEHLLLTSMANRASRKNTKRFKSGRFVVFVLGILILTILVNAEAHAMSPGVALPNGIGFSIKMPLKGSAPDTKATELHMFTLHNRSKTLRLEAPAHGRFVRLKLARMQLIMPIAKKRGKHALNAPRGGVRARLAAQPASQYRKTSSAHANVARNNVAITPSAHYIRRKPATASAAVVSRPEAKCTKLSKIEARRIARDLVTRYAVLRERYIRLRTRSPKRARRAYRRLMKFYAAARSWQQHAN